MVTKSNWRIYPYLAFVMLSASIAIGQVLAPQQIAQAAFPSVVMLGMEDANGQLISFGSGFFIRENIIVTNMHVIEGAARGYAKIVGQNTRYDIEGIVGYDVIHDIVLLSIKNAKAPFLRIGDSNKVVIGEEVFAIGNPLGLEGSFSQGIIGGIRTVGVDKLLQITAPISPGSSGGPVFNTSGAVIGISVATIQGGQNLNFAIPSSYLFKISLQQIKQLSVIKNNNRSIVDYVGNKSIDGVVGENFLWDGLFSSFTVSLRNMLRDDISNIVAIVIFYDVNNRPLDYALIQCKDKIPGGLAKRVSADVDPSIKKLTTKPKDFGYEDVPSTKLVIRVLDFTLEQ